MASFAQLKAEVSAAEHFPRAWSLWGSMTRIFSANPAANLPELNAALAELEGLIYSEDFCTEGGLSLDDIDLWSRLRSVTLVKGAQFGPKTTAYLKNLEAKGDVPLYFSLAC